MNDTTQPRKSFLARMGDQYQSHPKVTAAMAATAAATLAASAASHYGINISPTELAELNVLAVYLGGRLLGNN